MARQSTKRAPRLSTIVPMNGDVKAANIPPSDTAPEIIVRDHSSSMVIGVTNIDSVATAGPCLANPALAPIEPPPTSSVYVPVLCILGVFF